MKLRHLSIARKLRVMMMATTAVSLILACLAFAAVDIASFRTIRIHDAETLAEMTALHSAAPLMFNDRETASEVLSALQAKQSIRAACIFDRNGEPFAWYTAPDARFTPLPLTAIRKTSRLGEYHVYRDIAINGYVVGTMFISGDIRVPYAHAGRFAIAAATILLVSLVLAYFVSSPLQRHVSAPIRRLARIATEVTLENNFAARVPVEASDPQNEIGHLIVAFNQMLAEIERRETALETHRHELERQVAMRTAELRATVLSKKLILNSAAEGIISLDDAGAITVINQPAANALGRPVADLVGKRLHDLIHVPEQRTARVADCPMCSTTLNPAVRAGKRTALVSRNGARVPIEYTASTMIDVRSSMPLGVVVTFRDITERLAIDRMKDEFVSTVSHELRTPLTSIRGALGLLASGLIGSITNRGQKMLDIAVSNTDRLVRLINDILDLERIDSGQVELNPTDCDAADLMTTAVDGIQTYADRAGVQIDVADVHESLRVDGDRIVQTLTNLLSNAVKFSQPGSTVRVSGERGADAFTFVVEDNGRGIPASHLESIFERFKQVDSSDSRNKNGTGLGLAICKSIVDAHGGRIWAQSLEGSGTTFRFTIPVHRTQAAGGRQRRVIVFGDAALREVVAQRGFDVVIAHGAEDLARSCGNADAILVDVADGNAQAMEWLQQVASASPCHVPIVVAAPTARESFENYADAIAQWVMKPCSNADIVDAVANAVHPGPAVLLVEDDADLARVVVASLQTRGIETRHVVTGREAIAACREAAPRLVILDLGLPDVDGFGVVEWMKSNSLLANTPLVVYSAREVSTAEQDRLRLGPTEFLTKSRVSLEQFESRVVDLLSVVTENEAAARAA